MFPFPKPTQTLPILSVSAEIGMPDAPSLRRPTRLKLLSAQRKTPCTPIHEPESIMSIGRDRSETEYFIRHGNEDKPSILNTCDLATFRRHPERPVPVRVQGPYAHALQLRMLDVGRAVCSLKLIQAASGANP